MVVDGTVFDVPDTEANARVWGYPGSRPGTPSLPFRSLRLVMLVEAGTHLRSRCKARVPTAWENESGH